MSTEAMFSFDSPKSYNVSIGSSSFAINVEYIASMKFLFDKPSLYPVTEDKENVVIALNLVDSLIGTELTPNTVEYNEYIRFFYNKFLVPDSEFYSKENLQFLHTRLNSMLDDIDLWMRQNIEKQRRIDEATTAELQLIPLEAEKLIQRIQHFSASGRDMLLSEEQEYFGKIDRIFKRVGDTWLYQIILNDTVARFYFLQYMTCDHLKTKFIVQCIENGNYERANFLIDLLIETSNYSDYNPKTRNKWEHYARLTILYVLKEYYSSDSQWEKTHSADNREFAVSLAERLLPFLSKETQKEVLGPLTMADPLQRFKQRYIDNLLNDVEHYAQIRRPRGWAGAPVVNRISAEIIDCFAILEKINRIDVIVSVLEMLREPGAALTPINYARWYYEFCREGVSPETYDIIVDKLKWRK